MPDQHYCARCGASRDAKCSASALATWAEEAGRLTPAGWSCAVGELPEIGQRVVGHPASSASRSNHQVRRVAPGPRPRCEEVATGSACGRTTIGAGAQSRAPSCHTKTRGVMCGPPSGRVVVNQATPARARRSRTRAPSGGPAPSSPYRASCSATGSVTGSAMPTDPVMSCRGRTRHTYDGTQLGGRMT